MNATPVPWLYDTPTATQTRAEAHETPFSRANARPAGLAVGSIVQPRPSQRSANGTSL
jgi:hypothetical protein